MLVAQQQYCRRGFRPHVIDPNCQHPSPCRLGPFDRPSLKFSQSGLPIADDNTNQTGNDVNSREITAWQKANRDKCEFICCGGTRNCYLYTIIMFERAEGEVINFLSKRDKWSQQRLAEIQSMNPWSLICCRKCRYDYENYAFIGRQPSYWTKYDAKDDHGDNALLSESSFKRRHERRSIFKPVFYSGGVFDGRRQKNELGGFSSTLCRLDSQLLAEKARYFDKNGGSYDGYKPRFVYGGDIDHLFRNASKVSFEEHKRNPVGLNPERFVATCKHCRQWLMHHEYGTEYCDECQTTKTASATSRSSGTDDECMKKKARKN